jgi:hypothetical protein
MVASVELVETDIGLASIPLIPFGETRMLSIEKDNFGVR